MELLKRNKIITYSVSMAQHHRSWYLHRQRWNVRSGVFFHFQRRFIWNSSRGGIGSQYDMIYIWVHLDSMKKAVRMQAVQRRIWILYQSELTSFIKQYVVSPVAGLSRIQLKFVLPRRECSSPRRAIRGIGVISNLRSCLGRTMVHREQALRDYQRSKNGKRSRWCAHRVQ